MENILYKQSERREIYKENVQKLLDAGKAYIAFDTPEELEAAREQTPNFQYDAHTRGSMRNSLTMPKEEVDRLIADGVQYVVRFKIEPDRDVIVNDLIRGEVKINSGILDDKVLYKSADNLPTYHLANIVDDHLMEVSHVIRGEEWFPSAPLHVLLYEAFGWTDTMPRFVHLPLLLKPVGNGKLSSAAATSSVSRFSFSNGKIPCRARFRRATVRRVIFLRLLSTSLLSLAGIRATTAR